MQGVLGSNLGQDIKFFFLKILFIPFIRDFQTYNFMSDLTAQWARASVEVPSSLMVMVVSSRPALAHSEKHFFPTSRNRLFSETL
jgi:hypothetical protein